MTESTPIVLTDRLSLRAQRAADIPQLLDLWCDPRVTRYMGGPRDRAVLQADLEQVARRQSPETFDLWPVEHRSSGRVIGHCGLIKKTVAGATETELVYVIAHQDWGRGFATEIGGGLIDYAFATLHLADLIALIDPANAGSERVAQKLGMLPGREVVRPGGAVRRLYRIVHNQEERNEQ